LNVKSWRDVQNALSISSGLGYPGPLSRSPKLYSAAGRGEKKARLSEKRRKGEFFLQNRASLLVGKTIWSGSGVVGVWGGGS